LPSLLVFAKPDNTHPDPEVDRQKLKRGHVVDAREDNNFFWGRDIERLGWWKVVEVSAAPARFYKPLIKPGENGDLRREMLDLDEVLACASAKSQHKVKVLHSRLKVIPHGG
jgi:hypothetical protein